MMHIANEVSRYQEYQLLSFHLITPFIIQLTCLIEKRVIISMT